MIGDSDPLFVCSDQSFQYVSNFPRDIGDTCLTIAVRMDFQDSFQSEYHMALAQNMIWYNYELVAKSGYYGGCALCAWQNHR